MSSLNYKMLPTTLVAITSFLLKLYSASPVYSWHPSLITQSGGMANGRNIRNLPCISRKSNNQMGICMFAIDCLKSNGTHLGTCVDRFYFGSCCLIEKAHEILDNRIETEILDHRVPPMRISNTTTTPFMNTEKLEILDNEKNQINNKPISTEMYIVNTTESVYYNTTKITQKDEMSTEKKPNSGSTETLFLEKTSTEPTVFPQKLQTFQVIDSTTKKISTSSTKISTTSKTTTIKPTQRKPTKPTKFSSSKRPPKPSKPTGITSKPTTSKPTRSTRPSTTTSPVKPFKSTTKVSQVLTSTRKPQVTTTKKTITSKPTTASAKPSNHSPFATSVRTTTQRLPISSSPSSTVASKPPSIISNAPTSLSGINKFTPEIPTTKKTITTSSRPTSFTTPISISSSLNSNAIESNKINASEILEQVNGNLVTNEIEIEIAKPVQPISGEKPTVVTFSVMDEKNYTTPMPTTSITYNHTEAWIPVTTPDSWVLLPSVSSNVENTSANIFTSLAETPQSIYTSIIPITAPSIVPNVSGVPSITTSISTEPLDIVSPPEQIITTEKEKVESISTVPVIEVVTVLNSTVNSDDKTVNMSDFTDVCGRRMYPEARIVGGEKSSFGKWPWQISLRQWRTSTYLHKCGAALLNENWAITAAHCVDHVPPSDLLLRLGEHDLSTEEEPYIHQERRVQIVASHPQFDPRTFEYDLALLRFYEPVVFQPNILPVCVPQTDENFVGRTAYVTGWGRLYEDGPLPSLLQEVSVPVINNTVCESMYRTAGYIEHIPHIFICAGWRKGGFDSCEGDSGGPMVIQREDRRFLLAGVISWGIGCAEPNQPGVYTRISEFREWINQILKF